MKKIKKPGYFPTMQNFPLNRKAPLSTAILLALASAQGGIYAAEPSAERLEEITITGSRIRTNGMETSNPVTVVTLDQLNITAPTTLVEGLAALPQFYQSNTTENTGGFFTTSGAGSLNLRGLEGKRTLTLLSSRRVVSSTIYGGPDINLFPKNLIKTVETVTSGATAAYGTDAVAGVVNIILDTGFEGYRGSVQSGQTARGDNNNYEISLAGGWALTEKSHLLLSGESFDQEGVYSRDGYDWFTGSGLIQNNSATAGQTPDNPIRKAYPNVTSISASLDGILRFPASVGKYIFDKSGNAVPFVAGTASDNLAQTGGSGTNNNEPEAQIIGDADHTNYFGFLDYDLSDDLTVYGQVIDSEASFTNTGAGGYLNGLTIYSGNPFLPANVQKLMTDNKIASVPFGRIGADEDIAGNAWLKQETQTRSYTAGFDLDITADGFFDGWVVNGYYQKGTTDVQARQIGGIRLDRIYLAIDAVTDANGKTVCNVTKVSGQYPSCVPINLFGRGKASAAAVDWVTGFEPGVQVNTVGYIPNSSGIPYSYTSTADKKRVIELKQDVWELSANGDIFEGWGAGPISMAVGYDHRKESFIQFVQAPEGNPTADNNFRPVAANNAALGIRGVPAGDANNSVEIQFSKVPFGIGGFTVKEAFTEFRIPLFADKPLIDRLEFTAAARWASYSGSGDVWSWKGGLDWAVNDLVRLRATVSQDVRAATLGERYDRTGSVVNPIDYLADPLGSITYQTFRVSGGNPSVNPEEGKTYTAGFVYQPDWLDGLSLSIDWYDISIKDNINAFGVANILSGCYQEKDADLCKLIERTGPPITDINGKSIASISIVNDVFINVNSQDATGVDFEVSYGTNVDWFGGGEFFNVRALGSYLSENSRTNSAGLKTLSEGTFGLPDWKFQVSAGYNRGPLNLNLQARFTAETLQSLNNNIYQANFKGGAVRYDVADNTVDSSVLVDGRISYNFAYKGGNINLFGNVNNLFDEDPQEFLEALSGLSQAVGDGHVGDKRGRRYVVGFKFDF